MNHAGWTYRQERVSCGKNCRSCPNHGPYWYAYRFQDGKVRKKYVGKELPEDLRGHSKKAEPDIRDEVFRIKSDPWKLALRILGIAEGTEYRDARKHYLRLSLLHHPDRGGDTHEMQLVGASWAVLKKHFGWEK